MRSTRLLRGRAFVQDDAHIFCAPDQVEAEVARFCRLVAEVYGDFGFADWSVALSTRPEPRIGSEAQWDEAEARLAAAAAAAGLEPRPQPGEGALYGPKLEFVLRDSRGRAWQCGTIQLDLVMPERFDLAYVDAEGRKVRPVMLHQAVLGSLERFLAILLEHHGGRLPLWLAPEQILVASLGAEQAGRAEEVAAALEEAGFRTALDLRPERLGRKVAEAHAAGIPALLAIGRREAESGRVSLRLDGGAPEELTVAGVIERLRPEAFR
ncbi:Anticodon binding domain-containing protein [Tistlia consotensis]|uniref:threonine--tRNA ligase n=1 Tax=Tistlia consotensis USBA 355 TaxID=560819 RepID=A0A1Y6BZ83_9PROT|nr:threonine--tRNA ligase [Tistlia consotensis]SMF35905.1 threonyl-tRNA synthetase [Tistlia consotensis USBA 355]SNR71080.1 Anticodon binding domain-containing protein [Tistlia consotensis]